MNTKVPFTRILSREDLLSEMVKASQDTNEEVLTKRQAGYVLSMLQKAISASLSRGEKIVLAGFLQIEPAYRPERNAMNLRENVPVTVPEKIVAKISPGSTLKNSAESCDESFKTALREYYFQKREKLAKKSGDSEK